MTIFKVAYEPPFSQRLKEKIAEELEPSMVNPSDYGAQFVVDNGLEAMVKVYGDEEDVKTMEQLKSADIDYVEIN